MFPHRRSEGRLTVLEDQHQLLSIDRHVVGINEHVPKGAEFVQGLAEFPGEERRSHAFDSDRQSAYELGVPATLIVYAVLECLGDAQRHLLDDVVRAREVVRGTIEGSRRRISGPLSGKVERGDCHGAVCRQLARQSLQL